MEPNKPQDESGHPEIRNGGYDPRASVRFGSPSVQGGYPESQPSYASDSFGSQGSETKAFGF